MNGRLRMGLIMVLIYVLWFKTDKNGIIMGLTG